MTITLSLPSRISNSEWHHHCAVPTFWHTRTHSTHSACVNRIQPKHHAAGYVCSLLLLSRSQHPRQHQQNQQKDTKPVMYIHSPTLVLFFSVGLGQQPLEGSPLWISKILSKKSPSVNGSRKLQTPSNTRELPALPIQSASEGSSEEANPTAQLNRASTAVKRGSWLQSGCWQGWWGQTSEVLNVTLYYILSHLVFRWFLDSWQS